MSSLAFIDENDLAVAEKTVEDNKRMFCQFDPRGNLVVEVEGEEIVVKQLTVGSDLLAEFRQNGQEEMAARKLMDRMVMEGVISRIDHAIYIGIQLGRAEDAIKLGRKYEQDKDLVE